MADMAEPVLRIAIQPDSRLWFEGGSTVRGWDCEATTLEGVSVVEVEGDELSVAALNDAAATIELDIPVAKLECGNGKMNDHMRKALRAGDHPTIVYRHDAHELVTDAAGDAAVRMTGRLTIAGEEREITLDGAAAIDPDGALRISGSHELDMTEFGIEPPKLMLGTLKVHERVTIHFDMVLRP